MAEREPVIGIDLGTTHSVLATVRDGNAEVIPNRSGGRLTPSILALAQNGRRLVGQLAKRQAVTNPERTLYATKRLIGRKFSSEQVSQARKVLPYPVVAGEHDDVRVKLGEEILSLPEISAAILAELKKDAEAHFGRPVSQAVITVPAYFNDGQRQATKDAGRIAGLEVLRILNEPTAAALAYGAGRGADGKIAVFDLGGGTFDVSILSIGAGVYDVLATGGDTYLGGEDFDLRIIDFLAIGFAKEHGIDLRRDRMALQRLREAAERAKIELSTASEAKVNLPFIHTPEGGGSALHLQAPLTRAQLEALTSDLCERTCTHFNQVLSESKLRAKDLSEILFVGGMTRMPRILELVRERFGKDPCKGVHPDEVVALGAAVQAEALTAPKKKQQRQEVLLLDVTPQSLGVAITGGWVRTLIPKNTTIPTSTTEVFHTSRDGQKVVKIMVLQGEQTRALDNELLGEFVLEGIREAPRGQVEVEVTFEISSEGIVSVAAKDKETGLRQSLVVTASGGLTREELGAILESRKDELVSAGPSPEMQKAQSEATALSRAVEALVARLGSEAFEVAAAQRASAALAKAKSAMAEPESGALPAALDQLGRIQQVLEAMLGPEVSGGAAR